MPCQGVPCGLDGRGGAQLAAGPAFGRLQPISDKWLAGGCPKFLAGAGAGAGPVAGWTSTRQRRRGGTTRGCLAGAGASFLVELQPISDGAVGARSAVSGWNRAGRRLGFNPAATEWWVVARGVRLRPGRFSVGLTSISDGTVGTCPRSQAGAAFRWAASRQRRSDNGCPSPPGGHRPLFGRTASRSDGEARTRSARSGREPIGVQAGSDGAASSGARRVAGPRVDSVEVLSGSDGAVACFRGGDAGSGAGSGAVSVGVQAGGDGGRCGGGRGVLPGPGLAGLACLRGTAGAAKRQRWWLGCGRCGRCGRCGGPGRPASRVGAGAGAGAGAGSAALAGSGCAGGVGSPSAKVVAAVRWVWRSWGCVVAGVCMCGVTSFRCCVLRTACCRLPFVNCRLRTVDWGQWAFPVCPSCVCCRFGVCASFGALPPVGVIPSGRSLAPRFRVRPSGFLGLGASPDSTWGIPCEPRAETGPSYGRVVSDPASGASRPEAWLSLLAPTRLLYGIHIPVRTPIIHHPRNTRITHKTRNFSCSTPIRLHPNRNQSQEAASAQPANRPPLRRCPPEPRPNTGPAPATHPKRLPPLRRRPL